jgi:GTP-binding protein
MRISDKKKNVGNIRYTEQPDRINHCLEFRSVVFDKSYDEAPTRLPLVQFAFCGRSNVGKSSLINALLARNIAFVSKSPGKTILINTFLVNDSFYIVDLPGYGYAKRSKTMRKKWQKTIEEYLSKSNMLFHIFVLIDSRHKPLDSDMEFIRWLKFYNKDFSVVFTKTDKSKQKDIYDNVKYIKEQYGDFKYFFTSSTKKKGLDKLCSFMVEYLENISA